MLNLEDILWVIPGVYFVYIYNRRRPNEIISLTGWSYLFLIVFVAVFTWMPAEGIVNWIGQYSLFKSGILKTIITVMISIILSSLLFLIIMIEKIFRLISFSIYDNFHKKCIECENKLVLLTLKNRKTYIGILRKYPENTRSSFESQSVSIIPFISGYRKSETNIIDWNIEYLKERLDNEMEIISKLDETEILIPRSEIITLRKYNKEIFDQFYHNNAS